MPYAYTSQSHVEGTRQGAGAEGNYHTHGEDGTYPSTWDFQSEAAPCHWTYIVDTSDDYAEAQAPTSTKKRRSHTKDKHVNPRQATFDLPSTSQPTPFERRAKTKRHHGVDRDQSSVPRSFAREQYLTENNLGVLQCDLAGQWPAEERDEYPCAAWVAAEQWQWQAPEQSVLEQGDQRAR